MHSRKDGYFFNTSEMKENKIDIIQNQTDADMQSVIVINTNYILYIYSIFTCIFIFLIHTVP